MGQRDDRVLWSMQWVALVVVVLLPALVILWGIPGETADLWAWTIKPDLAPIFMGAGYGAGAYFFARVSWASTGTPAPSACSAPPSSRLRSASAS